MFVCPACGYPFPSGQCENPACSENPNIPASIKQQQAEQAAKRRQEEAEREKFARIRNACFAK